MVLLLGAGMLVHSLIALQHQDAGFRPENVLLVKTDPRIAGYQPNELLPLYRAIDGRLNSMPGVVSASLASYTPESNTNFSSSFSIQGYTPGPGKQLVIDWVAVGPRFFQTLGIPLLLGRAIGPRDTPASPPVAVVNETFVKTYLPNQNPIGRLFSFQTPFQAPGFEIVGIVGDSKYYDLRNLPKPMAFFSVWQPQPMEGPNGWQPEFAFAGDLLIRTSHGTSDIASAVRRVLNDIGSKLPVLEVTTLEHQIDRSLEQQKLMTSLCSVFGVLALVLAAIGIYGTLAYSVTRRTSEIGIRMAIGAQRSDVLWLILRDSIILIGAGLAFGFPIALIATRWLKSFLFGVPPADPLAIGSAVLLIAALALLAGYLPARRATKIEPVSALRYE
jgi:macrolide transport system ATP-binding/permease protein